jgi:hypothetical protein
MNDDTRDLSASPDASVAKRPWHPPTLDEIDVVETETGPGPAYAATDFSTYAS